MTTIDAERPQLGRPLTADEILANATARAARIRDDDLARTSDALRRLPTEVVELVREAGVMRMAMPRAWGGPEMTSMQQVEVIEALARADASVAWCSFIWCDSGIYSGYLDDEVARQMYPSLDMATSGWVYPVGRARRVPGGYVVSGDWMFGSGSHHCDWLVGGCAVDDAGSTDPADLWRIVLAPRDAYELLDTWYTTGLRGTGSTDYRVRDLFVPEERTFSFLEPARRSGKLWARPDTLLRKMAGVPLGVAADALDTARHLMETKADRLSGVPYRTMPRVRSTIAEAQALLGSARAYVFESLEAQWVKLGTDEPLTAEERANVWLSRTNAFQVGRTVVGLLYDLVGGSAIYADKGPFDRHLRDMQTACQHIVAQTKTWEAVGQLLLGDDAGHPLI